MAAKRQRESPGASQLMISHVLVFSLYLFSTRLFPRITAMIFTAAGLAFSITAAVSCEFIIFSTTTLGNGQAGLFQYQSPTSGECIEYPDNVPLEQTDTAARTCAALAAIFGLAALCLLLFEFCICKIPCARCLESMVFAVAYVCQGCTFLAYNNSSLW